MTTQLPERLRDLADEAPGPLSAAGLWRDGHRRRRRRVVAAALVAGAVVAVTAGAGYGDWRSRRPEPVKQPVIRGDAMAVPDRLFNPSPWTPTTSAPGRLVAVFTSNRDRFPFGSDENAVVGVAAGSQTYRFLDLPGQSPDATDVSLSPDGRRLAYWINGAPTGAARLGDGSILGVAVLDLMSGSVERHVFNTEHGLAAGTVRWIDDDTIAMSSDLFTSRDPTSYAGRERDYVLTVGNTDSYQRLAGRVRDDIPVTSTSGYAVMTGPRVLRSGTPGGTDAVRLSRSVRSVTFDAAQGVAAIDRGPNVDGATQRRLLVGLVSHGRVDLAAVPGDQRYYQVLAWADATHVATSRITGDGIVYDLVDVRTGERQQLSSKPWYAYSLALDALRQPVTVRGVEPPQPWNPRLIALGGLLAVVCLGGVLLVARRSRGSF